MPETTLPPCPVCGGADVTEDVTIMVGDAYRCEDCGSWMRDRKNAMSREKRAAMRAAIE